MLKKWNVFLNESIQKIGDLPISQRRAGWKRFGIVLMIWILVSVVCFSISNQAHAEIILNNLNDTMLQAYKDASGGWTSILMDHAKKLFFYLAAIEIAWAGIFWIIEKDNLSSFTAELIKKTLFIGFFYALLLNGSEWIPAIVYSFSRAGQEASNIPMGLSPSEILSVGLTLVDGILDIGKTLHLWNVHLTAQLTASCSLFLIACFGLIAYQFLATMVEMYIIIAAGALFLGFGGSSFTKDYVMKFLGYAVSVGIKLMMIYLIVGVGSKLAIGWETALLASTDENFFRNLSVVCSAVFIYTNLVSRIPDFMASLIGSGTGTAGAGALGGAHSGGAQQGMAGANPGSMGGGAGGVGIKGTGNTVSHAAQVSTSQFGQMTPGMQSYQNTANTMFGAGMFTSIPEHSVHAHNMPAPSASHTEKQNAASEHQHANMKQGSAVPFEPASSHSDATQAAIHAVQNVEKNIQHSQEAVKNNKTPVQKNKISSPKKNE